MHGSVRHNWRAEPAPSNLISHRTDGTSYHSGKQKRAAGGNPTDSRSVSYPFRVCRLRN